MALETFFKFANRPGVEQVRQNQIQAQLDRKMANEQAQRNAIAEMLNNRSKQLANVKAAREMANFGQDTFGNPVQLQDGSYGQPVFNQQGQFVRFQKMPGYNPRSKEKRFGDPILLQDGTYAQPETDASGQVVGMRKVAGFNPMKTTEPDYELATYLSDAEQLEFTNPQTSQARMRQLTTKAEVAKRRARAEPTFAQKEQIKADVKRAGELSSGAGLRETSLTEAKRFLGAFKGNKEDYESFGLDGPADSGQTRVLIDMLPGKFSAQSKFEEQLDAFAEQAARQLLKAAGEVRPTDADVAGAKKALFGVGKDEATNIRLLENYIRQQEQLEAEAQRLSKNDGSRFTIEEID
tara:strand:- start:739 stop:1791 length:1053 start_codon:yes stop_codon:yes gene_type:complete